MPSPLSIRTFTLDVCQTLSRRAVRWTYESRASIEPKRIPDPMSLMSSTAVSFSSQPLLFNKDRRRSISGGYWCFMPRALTLLHSLESCSCMAPVFMRCKDDFPRDRAVILPDGSPITTVPPPSYSTLTCCCRTRPWLAHQADGVVAVDEHPIEHHEREKMTDVEGRRGRVYTNIGAYGLFCEQPVERFSSTEAC
jgi:hypothetical protein